MLKKCTVRKTVPFAVFLVFFGVQSHAVLLQSFKGGRGLISSCNSDLSSLGPPCLIWWSKIHPLHTKWGYSAPPPPVALLSHFLGLLILHCQITALKLLRMPTMDDHAIVHHSLTCVLHFGMNCFFFLSICLSEIHCSLPDNHEVSFALQKLCAPHCTRLKVCPESGE